ncbi:M48 family metallopeptidase [Candidatus Saccharibacteria bacterium]|nr:M48 family metallopeptidase [Candidatus Saccharibacteria bacterium]
MQKSVYIDGIGHPIIIARRKGTRSLRLSIKTDGTLRVTVPYGVPEFMAKKFVTDKREWIEKHLKPQTVVRANTHIGKNHQLIIKNGTGTRPSSRVSDTEIRVTLPAGMLEKSPEAQKTIKRACEKALLQEAERLLPQRLETISKQKNVPYKSCTVKKLKSRWGACDNHKNISLNSYLIQLDWALIDYVICHELAHTEHHHHQPRFWEFVERLNPNYKSLRKELKSKPTDIIVS